MCHLMSFCVRASNIFNKNAIILLNFSDRIAVLAESFYFFWQTFYNTFLY